MPILIHQDDNHKLSNISGSVLLSFHVCVILYSQEQDSQVN